VITGFERKGTCKKDKEKKCIAYIVGLKFVATKLNEILANIEKSEGTSDDNLAASSKNNSAERDANLTENPTFKLTENSSDKLIASTNDKIKENSSNKLTEKPTADEKLTMNGLKKMLMEKLEFRIQWIVDTTYAMDKTELQER
jgi:hypothetical protein